MVKKRIVQEEKEYTIQESQINVVVQFIDVETSKVIASTRVSFNKWNEYDIKVRDLVKPLTNNLTFKNSSRKSDLSIFIGKWEVEIYENSIYDVYTFEFNPNFSVFATVVSTDLDGNSKTISKRGHYNYQDGILELSINMPNDQIPHIQEIKWNTLIQIDNSQAVFKAVVPISSKKGSQKVSTDFYKID